MPNVANSCHGVRLLGRGAELVCELFDRRCWAVWFLDGCAVEADIDTVYGWQCNSFESAQIVLEFQDAD